MALPLIRDAIARAAEQANVQRAERVRQALASIQNEPTTVNAAGRARAQAEAAAQADLRRQIAAAQGELDRKVNAGQDAGAEFEQIQAMTDRLAPTTVNLAPGPGTLGERMQQEQTPDPLSPDEPSRRLRAAGSGATPQPLGARMVI